jgi:hypothetical protein
MLLVLSIVLLENFYSTGVTHDNCHSDDLNVFIVQATGEIFVRQAYSLSTAY